MQALFENMSRFISLSSDLKDAIEIRTNEKSFKKGELVHSADRICRHSYFIEDGILRLYLNKDGKEITEFFCSKGEWINSPRSFMNQTLDHYYIDVIEDCHLVSLGVDDLLYLFDRFPEMERYARLDMTSSFGYILERVTSMRFTSALEKYEHFRQTYPGYHHKIPLGMVASYLGITQETLSRIRAKV